MIVSGTQSDCLIAHNHELVPVLALADYDIAIGGGARFEAPGHLREVQASALSACCLRQVSVGLVLIPNCTASNEHIQSDQTHRVQKRFFVGKDVRVDRFKLPPLQKPRTESQ